MVEEERWLIKEVNWEGERWRVGTVYIKGNLERVLKRVRKEVDERRGEKVGFGGDFNARTGEEEEIEDNEEGIVRRSMNKTINKQGEKLLKWMGEES